MPPMVLFSSPQRDIEKPRVACGALNVLLLLLVTEEGRCQGEKDIDYTRSRQAYRERRV